MTAGGGAFRGSVFQIASKKSSGDGTRLYTCTSSDIKYMGGFRVDMYRNCGGIPLVSLSAFSRFRTFLLRTDAKMKITPPLLRSSAVAIVV